MQQGCHIRCQRPRTETAATAAYNVGSTCNEDAAADANVQEQEQQQDLLHMHLALAGKHFDYY